jgi:hypothetical protein
MRIQSNFKFLTAVTTTAVSNTFTNSICDGLTLQITGTHSGATILVEGQVSPDSTLTNWVALSVINLNDFSVVDSITANGVYQVGIAGISQIRVVVSAISSGTVTAFGAIYREGVD